MPDGQIELALCPPDQPCALSFRSHGVGDPVVFIHPYLLDSRYWLRCLEGLGNEYRCLAPDLRWHGLSRNHTRLAFDEADDARDLIAFIKSHCPDQRVHLVGFSAGAIIGALVAKKAPKLVRSLTVSSATFVIQPDAAYKRYQAELARFVVVEGTDVLFRRFDEYIYARSASLMARARYKTMLAEQPLEMIVAFLTGNALDARPDLPGQVKAPVFLPYGDQDVLMTPERVPEMEALYDDVRSLKIADAGRLLPLEQPNAFNDALCGFWAAVD